MYSTGRCDLPRPCSYLSMFTDIMLLLLAVTSLRMSSHLPSYPVRKKLLDSQKSAIEAFKKDPKISYESASCMICGNQAPEVWFNNDRYGIEQSTVLCTECGLVYSSPRMDEDSLRYFYQSDLYRRIYAGENLEERYRNLYEVEFNYDNQIPDLESYKASHFFHFIQSLDLNYASVCEVGAGGGWNLIPFQKSGKTVIGYEPSPKMCAMAGDRGIRVIEGFVDNMEGEYDLVILKHVLEHFLNPLEILKSVRKHVGQYLYIEVPGIVSQMPGLQNAHVHYFSPRTLEYVTTRAGFKTLSLDYCKSNDFLLGVFEKADGPEVQSYSREAEVQQMKNIYRKYKSSHSRNSFLRSIGLHKVYRKVKRSIRK